MIKYGLISETDARTLEKTMDLICDDFFDEGIRICEVGVYGGDTAGGINKYMAWEKHRTHFITGIDNNKDGEINRFGYYKFIEGNSNEVYNQLEDESQHLIFIDGLHTFAGVISDFFCYAPKVKVGGFLAFHDTGKHIDPLSGWQGVGDKNDPDMCLGGVGKAISAIGLPRKDWLSKIVEIDRTDWQLIFDEADETNEAGGICVFKKLN